MRTQTDPAEDYLRRVDKALAPLPAARRREIVEELSAHIEEARGELPANDDGALLTLLDRLGDPEEIAADARDRLGVPARERGWLEIGAIVLLLIGGFLAGVGWVAGVVLLWMSSIWTVRDKLIGTLVVPGGLATAGFIVTASVSGSCSGTPETQVCTAGPPAYERGLWIAVFVLTIVGPFFTAIYLTRRSKRLSADR